MRTYYCASSVPCTPADRCTACEVNYQRDRALALEAAVRYVIKCSILNPKDEERCWKVLADQPWPGGWGEEKK